MTQDEEHLRWLSIFHYVVGGLAALFSLIPVIYIVLGILMLVAPETMESEDGEPASAVAGWIFLTIGIVGMGLGFVFAALIVLAGRFIAKRKHRTFCIVMAGIQCLFQPFGTVLGIFTIIVLLRQSVKELFEAKPHPQPSHDGHGHAWGSGWTSNH